ncbi:MAG: hypothetical protein QG616_663 [Pseudomonadota bacterium]|nr:hypothetical protein [Pseudomonadota bacterium]MDQ5942582.1 hypothetical protein [Pseudomonadota bacterium]
MPPPSAPVPRSQARPTRGTPGGPVRLTASRIESLKATDKRIEIADPACAGLQLRITPAGAKSWWWRFYWQGARQKLLIGTYPATTLAAAHDAVTVARNLLDRGIDPRTAERPKLARRRTEAPAATDTPAGRNSIENLCSEFMDRHVTPRRKQPAYVQRIIDKEILKPWAGRDARTIKPREVVELLDAIVDRGKPVMANRTAGVLSQLFRFGIHRSLIETSPVQLLYRPGGKEKPRDRALDDAELAALLVNLDEAARFRDSKLPNVLRILLLTGQRRGELALARWSDVDLKANTWTIPKENTKTGVGHVVPLSDWAAREFAELKKLADGSRFVLPASDPTKSADPKLITRSVARCQARLKKVGVGTFTPHDLRRTCRTGLARLKVEPHIAERVLNHAQETIPGTYDVHDYLDEKRTALDKWAAHLEGLTRSASHAA